MIFHIQIIVSTESSDNFQYPKEEKEGKRYPIVDCCCWNYEAESNQLDLPDQPHVDYYINSMLENEAGAAVAR